MPDQEVNELISLRLLEQVGEIVYGAHWQEPMAHALGISTRTLSRWLRGHVVPELATESPQKFDAWICKKLSALLMQYQKEAALREQDFRALCRKVESRLYG
jgi:hypothetical protein